MVADFAIRIGDIRHGWVRCAVEADGQSCETLAGHCSDTLGDLATAGAMAALGKGFRILFDNEANAPVWEFTADPDRFGHFLPVFAVWHIGQYAYEVEREVMHGVAWRDSAEKVFSVQTDYDTVAAAIAAEFHRLEAEMGVEGYQTAWNWPWPSQALAALRAATQTR